MPPKKDNKSGKGAKGGGGGGQKEDAAGKEKKGNSIKVFFVVTVNRCLFSFKLTCTFSFRSATFCVKNNQRF